MARPGGLAGAALERTYSAFEALREATIVADSSGRILFANGSCETLLGWTPDDLVGSGLTTIIPERLQPTHLMAFSQRVAGTGGGDRLVGHAVRVPVRRPDGSEVMAELLISEAGSSDDRIFVGTLRRVSDTSDIDQSTLVSKALLAALSGPSDFDHVVRRVLVGVAQALGWDAAAFWTIDDDLQQLHCDEFWSAGGFERFEAATRATLFPPGVGLPGRAWETGRAVWAEDVPSEPNFLRTRAAEATGIRSGVAFPLAAGARLVGVIECFARGRRPEDLEALAAMAGVGQVLGTFLDRGRDDEDRARLLDDVQTERARLQAVLRQLPLGVVITGPDGRVELANEAVEHLLGPPGADQRYRGVDIGDASDDKVKATPLALGTPMLDHDVHVRAPDGARRIVSMSAVPVHDRQGRTVSTVTTLVDVTDRRTERARFEQLYERSREIALTLQSSLLPPNLPTIPGLDLGACFLAGGEDLIVGGDFYDVSALDDGRWAVTIGDVCGSGAEAAAVTARVRYTARAAVERSHPAALLGRINAVLRAEADESSRFCTVIHGVVDVAAEGAHATLASGGHPPPLLVRTDGTVEELSCQGQLLGVFDRVRHTEATVPVGRGESLVLFTDGVTEAHGATGLFGDERLHAVLTETAGAPAASVAEAVGHAVLRHGGGHTADDVAVLVIRVDPTGRGS